MEPVLTSFVREPRSYTLDVSLQHGAYEGLKKALSMPPAQVIEIVKASGLRGRGGAGFPTGMKWSFVPKDSPKPKYVCCNADESEPGTFKDHVLMERNPHLVLEGVAIACYAIGAKVGLHLHPRRVLPRVRGARGGHRRGEGRRLPRARTSSAAAFDCDIYVHRGAGAYEAGEESALLESLEGKRAQPRLRPPFPAVVGLYGCPTIINNVETLANVPAIMTRGPEWFVVARPREERRTEALLRQRPRETPGVYEASMHTTLKQLIYDEQFAGGIRDGRHAQGGHPRRVVHARAAARRDRRAGQLRRRGQGRVDARVGRHDRHGRHAPAWCGRPRT